MAQMVGSEGLNSRNYQEQLAHSLIDCMGWENAVQAGQEITWDGVLDILLRQAPKH